MNAKRAFLILSAAAALRCAADTAWVVHPGSSATKRPLLHTCRNHGKPRKIAVDWTKWGKYPSLRVRDEKGSIFAGINTRGLALIQMAGDPNRDPNPELTPKTRTGGRLLVSIAAKCANAREAVETIRANIKSGKFFGGCIYLVADTKEAHVVECSPRHFSTWQLPHSFCVYTNSWKLPGMDDASTADADRARYLYQKEWIVRKALRRAMLYGGGISVAESVAASRINVEDARKLMPEKEKGMTLPITAAVGDKYAYGAVLFDIDAEYPALLSCVYLAVGHQRKVMYLPLPLGAAEDILKDDAFLRAAADTRRAAKQEFRFIADFAKTKAEARKLLAGGDGAGAKKLLVDMVKNNLAALAGNTPKAGGESK